MMLPRAPGDKKVLVADLETYPNWFCVAVSDGERRKCFSSHRPGEIAKLAKALRDKSIVVAGFNSFKYDDIILRAIVYNPAITPKEVRALSDRIIEPQDQEEEEANFKATYTDVPWAYSIDVFQLLNGKGSLKEHACRSHAPDVGETPYHFGDDLPTEGIPAVERYCSLDVINTEAKLRHLWKLVEMRHTLDVTFGLGARVYCLSEQGIAQATFLKLHRDRSGEYSSQIRESCKSNPDNRQLAWAMSALVAPKVQYHTRPFQQMFKLLLEGEMRALDSYGGKWEMVAPKLPEDLAIPLAGHRFQLGVGGLHSLDGPAIYRSTPTEKLIDLDVTSYYPSIVINEKLNPRQLPHFAEDMRILRDRRVKAKIEGNKAIANALKIVVNAAFGKLNDVWSPLRSVPDAMRVTLNGQLYLLMLIEQLYVVGAEILSANTDGVTIRWKGDEAVLKLAVQAWENATGFDLERTDYTVYARRDVNNYCAASADGVKVKGAFFLLPSQGGKNLKIKEGPDGGKGDGLIIKRAALEYLLNGRPICATVRSCRPEELMFYMRCKNGGTFFHGQEPIGKLARWYASVGGQPIKRKNPNGSMATIPNAQHATMLMSLDDFGCDIDFNYYEEQAQALVESCTL